MQNEVLNLEFYPFFFLFGVSEQPSNVGLALTDIFVQDLRAVDDFGFAGVQHFADLSSHQGFTRTRGAVQKDTLHVLTT